MNASRRQTVDLFVVSFLILFMELACIRWFGSIFVPMHTFLALPGAQRIIVSCAVVFVPVLFVGIIFSWSWRCCSMRFPRSVFAGAR